MNYDDLPKLQVGNLQVADLRARLQDVTPGYPRRTLQSIDRIIIHHSATNPVLPSVDAEILHIESIRRYHTMTHGWPGIGYHAVVCPSGNAYIVGTTETIRYHTASLQDLNQNGISDINDTGYGVCLIGDFTFKVPTLAQAAASAALVRNLEFGLGRALRLDGHRDYGSSECPGNTWPTWKDSLRPSSNDAQSRERISQATHLIWNRLDRIQALVANNAQAVKLAEEAKQQGVVILKNELGIV